ncbi:phytoene synthase [Aurantimonas sp. Leaf443]|nr:phytoene synthase [Aurantimonas sp. Leaf443]
MEAIAEEAIAQGSKSFAAAARLFSPDTRRDAVMLYAWCRHCDDVIDGQELGHRPDGPAPAAEDPAGRLERLTRQTLRAAEGRPGPEPAFRALASVVRRHDLPVDLLLDHIEGFRMDVAGRRYETIEDTLDYCHHVAGVVGLMMARIMGVRDRPTLARAADLGLAFQLSNIARDILPDAEVGRVYLPARWLAEAGIEAAEMTQPRHRAGLSRLAQRLVERAEPYYASARIGVDALPRRSAWAVETARRVYREIGLRVVERGEGALETRVSTSKADKIGAVARAAAVAFGPRRKDAPPRPATLWTHEGTTPWRGGA